MEYIYEKQRNNYEDFASGRVLLNAKGTTAFPVRLASELFQRGLSYLGFKNKNEKYSIYDPCCGGAYLLTTLGILHGKHLNRIVGSDIDGNMKSIALSNLAMVNEDGLENRLQQIEKMYHEYGKQSHLEAIKSAERLKKIVAERSTTIETSFFQADVTDPLDILKALEKSDPFDIIFTDLPYGELVEWKTTNFNPAERMLDHLLNVIGKNGIVIVVSDKKQAINHSQYNRLERLKIGKRQIVILQPKNNR